MDQARIAEAVDRLERNLPIRYNQTRLPASLRLLHQSILRHYLEHGTGPGPADIDATENGSTLLARLATEKIILVNPGDEVIGAYPFVNEARGFRVVTDYGPVNAMCAFDALAVSSMYEIPVRIEASCRISGCEIIIEQDRQDLTVIEPGEAVFAAIDWEAADGESCCATSLCAEMMFIVGKTEARQWQDENPASREFFELDEAYEVITAVFLPLIR